jgi:dTDP-4-dehydrorhamnose reductase
VRILVTGGRGQLAADVREHLVGNDVAAPSHEELDIADRGAVEAALEAFQPEVVINTAAFHDVDRCEEEPEASFAVNAAAVRRLAAACSRRDTLFVHFSTDYVFDGRKREPYVEEDMVAPINVYGCSKVAGEMAIRCTTERHLIIRTTGLYGLRASGASRSNFVETMLKLAAEGQRISVVCDQVLTPSYTRDVAAATLRLVSMGATGTWHVTNAGACSWYEFTREVFRITGLDADLRPVAQVDRPSPARRPNYSVLAANRLGLAGIPPLRPWEDALAAYFRDRG